MESDAAAGKSAEKMSPAAVEANRLRMFLSQNDLTADDCSPENKKPLEDNPRGKLNA
jgi:hypothetical protein